MGRAEASTAGATALPVVQAGAAWGSADFISDLHLQPTDPATFEAWRRYMESTPAGAIFILGDLFEAWIGDDAARRPGFEADCARVLARACVQRPVFFLHGNRDFLVGQALAADCGFTLLEDPCVLAFGGHRWLLTHGDALCLDDADYLRFREQVRAPEWAAQFLRRPLDERAAVARQMRDASQTHQRAGAPVAQVNAALARQWLARAGAHRMIHGHTHRPGEHDLGEGHLRIVLSDWDAGAAPPRLQALRLTPDGRFERIALP